MSMCGLGVHTSSPVQRQSCVLCVRLQRLQAITCGQGLSSASLRRVHTTPNTMTNLVLPTPLGPSECLICSELALLVLFCPCQHSVACEGEWRQCGGGVVHSEPSRARTMEIKRINAITRFKCYHIAESVVLSHSRMFEYGDHGYIYKNHTICACPCLNRVRPSNEEMHQMPSHNHQEN